MSELLERDQKTDEIEYMDRVLVTWSYWAFTVSSALGYPEAGNIWGLKRPGSRPTELNLDDDKLLSVDQSIAKLPWRTGRKVIFVEYFVGDPQEVKAKRFNLSRSGYRRKLDVLRYDLYQSLMPAIEDWRL